MRTVTVKLTGNLLWPRTLEGVVVAREKPLPKPRETVAVHVALPNGEQHQFVADVERVNKVAHTYDVKIWCR